MGPNLAIGLERQLLGMDFVWLSLPLNRNTMKELAQAIHNKHGPGVHVIGKSPVRALARHWGWNTCNVHGRIARATNVIGGEIVV